MNEIVVSKTSVQSVISNIPGSFIEYSLSENTKIAYGQDWKIFKHWCESKGCSFLPATVEDVRAFLIDQANSFIERRTRKKGSQKKFVLGVDKKPQLIKPATLVRRIAAIKWRHELNGFESPTQHKIIKLELQGLKGKRAIAAKKKAPATAERIESMIAHCDTDTLIGLRDRALLLLGFAGAFRRSELIALEVKDIERTPEGIKVTIPKSKTDQDAKGQMIAILNGTRLRVVDALYVWLNAANITGGAIFRSFKNNGEMQEKLTVHSVANIVKRYANEAGLNIADFSGHSLRSGFITSGAAAGADLFKLMEVSRHKKPETVMGYVRESKLFENHAGEKFL